MLPMATVPPMVMMTARVNRARRRAASRLKGIRTTGVLSGTSYSTSTPLTFSVIVRVGWRRNGVRMVGGRLGAGGSGAGRGFVGEMPGRQGGDRDEDGRRGDGSR